jgi:hypothetical protein
MAEVVSAAALLHDITHMPFGHTLEDEFAGIYERHDSLANSRLWEMFFNESSGLAKVLSREGENWLEDLTNQEIRRLLFVILSWKDQTDPACGFGHLLELELKKRQGSKKPHDLLQVQRLEQVREWHKDFVGRRLFHPFMSDVVGNTICADLLDYLPRDRLNLGMEYRLHTRLQRYLTIRVGTLYPPTEGLRLSIMVSRTGRGGQRRDVATAVLDIMRERYEMAERVYYHHKKASAGAMLAQLVELLPGDSKPVDDNRVYPAPWTEKDDNTLGARHVTHFTDSGFLEFLGGAAVPTEEKEQLQRKLYLALKFRRTHLYRTLLVVDTDLVHMSRHAVGYFCERLRGSKEDPSSKGQRNLEKDLAVAATGQPGDVLLYCPPEGMQAKEVDARLELTVNRVLPLRVQREAFAYHADVKVLEQYYGELWRLYVFVAPEIFSVGSRCKAVVDAFCDAFGIDRYLAYGKVRGHDFKVDEDVAASRALRPVEEHLVRLPFQDTPARVIGTLIGLAAKDTPYLRIVRSGGDGRTRLSSLLDVAIIKEEMEEFKEKGKLSKRDIQRIQIHREGLLAGGKQGRLAAIQSGSADNPWPSYPTYAKAVMELGAGGPD